MQLFLQVGLYGLQPFFYFCNGSFSFFYKPCLQGGKLLAVAFDQLLSFLVEGFLFACQFFAFMSQRCIELFQFFSMPLSYLCKLFIALQYFKFQLFAKRSELLFCLAGQLVGQLVLLGFQFCRMLLLEIEDGLAVGSLCLFCLFVKGLDFALFCLQGVFQLLPVCAFQAMQLFFEALFMFLRFLEKQF